ncbi:hypothetical protein J6590_001595 [Homalodisca vitripennis]|nr:hypothetical protein J6590_001595 [Homalodisca vitripennis]
MAFRTHGVISDKCQYSLKCLNTKGNLLNTVRLVSLRLDDPLETTEIKLPTAYLRTWMLVTLSDSTRGSVNNLKGGCQRRVLVKSQCVACFLFRPTNSQNLVIIEDFLIDLSKEHYTKPCIIDGRFSSSNSDSMGASTEILTSTRRMYRHCKISSRIFCTNWIREQYRIDILYDMSDLAPRPVRPEKNKENVKRLGY